MTVETSVRFRTHAKLNLFLRIIGSRSDGFHEVETILHGIRLYDEIEVEPGGDRLDVSMELKEDFGGELPPDRENLVRRAAELLLDGATDKGATIRVRKGIPIAAGLGGGSGNAAGALVVLAELWGLGFDRDKLLSLAEKLGADVPYCIEGGTVLATARGEQTTPLPSVQPMWFVLGGLRRAFFTRDVYQRWDELQPERVDHGSIPMTLALGAGDVGEVAALLHNDLEVAAYSLEPSLEDKKAALLNAGALGAAMTGSGPTMFGVARDEDHAAEVAAGSGGSFDWIKVVRSHPSCIERL